MLVTSCSWPLASRTTLGGGCSSCKRQQCCDGLSVFEYAMLTSVFEYAMLTALLCVVEMHLMHTLYIQRVPCLGQAVFSVPVWCSWWVTIL